MAITFIGANYGENNHSAFGTNIALPASVQNDLVLFFSACQYTESGGPPNTAGYTTIVDYISPTDGIRLTACYKFMGATPDTSVTILPSGSGSIGVVVAVLVFRGVSTTTPLDVAVVTTSGPSSQPDAPAITPANNNCCIVIAASTAVHSITVGSVNNYLPTPTYQKAINVTAGGTVAAAYRILSGGASVLQNPSAWTTWGTAPPYNAITIALRPVTTSTDTITVTKAAVVDAGKTVTGLETVAISKATIDYLGKTITTPDATVDSVFIDSRNIVWAGKTVDPLDVIRGIDITKASVLCRGRAVTPRDVQFEDIPRYSVRGRGSGHWMETR